MTELTDRFISDELEHFGKKGMHWGVRKEDGSLSDESKKKLKTGAIILGSAAAAAAIATGAYYIHKHYNVPTSTIEKSASKVAGGAFSKSMSQEPLGIVHAARGKNHGFTFPQRGGLLDPVLEYEKAGFSDSGMTHNSMKRYGDRLEKIAATFVDPEGRSDFAHRPIHHDVMLPEELAKNLNTLDDVKAKVWPLIKDTYETLYNASQSGA